MNIVDAYKKVCVAKDPYKTYAMMNKLEKSGLSIPDNSFSGIIDSNLYNAVRKNIQQTILRSGRKQANTQIMKFYAGDTSIKSIGFPKQWLDILKENNLKISQWKSKALFFKLQLQAWKRFIVTFITLLKNQFSGFTEQQKSHSFFINIPKNSLQNNSPYRSTLIDWFLDKRKIKKNELIYATPFLQKYYFPKLSIINFISFIIFTIKILFLGLFKWFFGNWASPFIMSEALEIKYFKYIKNPAKQYLFSNSNYAIRPLWTNIAENNGSKVILYFYSTNVNVFYNGQTKKSPPPPGYISMSWNEYWVTDTDQRTFLKTQSNINENIKITGSIDFTDNGEDLPIIPKKSISLFDITAFNSEYIANMALIAPYYTSAIIEQFIDDIIDVVSSFGGVVIWKQKRDMADDKKSSDYSDIIDKYKNNKHVIIVSPNINARRIIQKTAGTISLPYTSTAIIAKEEQKPSIYYDATGKLTYFNGLSHDIPVLQDKKLLQKWIENIFNGKVKSCAE